MIITCSFKMTCIVLLGYFICFLVHSSCAFQPSHKLFHQRAFTLFSTTSKSITSEINFDDLTVMDVILFQRKQADNQSELKLELGAMQETNTIAPLSTWTTESSYTSDTNDMMEFVVDEEDMFPGLTDKDIRVLDVLEGNVLGYGSRQVGGGKGLGNPHGEESELLYYIDRSVVEGVYDVDVHGEGLKRSGMMVELVVNPSLEVIW